MTMMSPKPRMKARPECEIDPAVVVGLSEPGSSGSAEDTQAAPDCWEGLVAEEVIEGVVAAQPCRDEPPKELRDREI